MARPSLDNLVTLYRAGVPVETIAGIYHHSQRWIYRELNRRGCPPSRCRRKTTRFALIEDDPLTAVCRDFYRRGMTIQEIADQIRRSFEYVSRRIVRAVRPPSIKNSDGRPKILPNGKRPVTPGERIKIRQLYAAGCNIAEIARELNRARSCIHHYLEDVDERFKIRQEVCPELGWPVPTTTPARALKGRRFEDIAPKPPSIDIGRATRNAFIFVRRGHENRCVTA